MTQVLLRAINMSGKLHMVPAVINDDYVIRFAVCSVDAGDDDIAYAWTVVAETTSRLASQSASFDLHRPEQQQMSESEEDEDETADVVTELVRSPVKCPPSAALNGDNVDDVFLFDNNIPSIATRIPASAEPADTHALRRRNRLLRLVSDPRVYSRGLQRSVSVQLDDRRHQCLRDTHSVPLTAGAHLSRHLTTIAGPGDDGDEEAGQRPTQSRPALTNGSWSDRWKNRSLDACCSGSGGTDASTMKRRGTLTAAKTGNVDDDLDHDDDDENAELASCVCNGLDDQPKNTPECSQAAN